MYYINRKLLIAAGMLSVLSAPALSETARLSVTTGIDYSTGDYGASVDTDTTFIPLTLKYIKGDLTLKASFSYISVTGPDNVLPDVGQVGGTSTTRTTKSGMGDTFLSATYTVYNSRKTSTIIDLTGKVKIPTANEDKDLGTGATDWYVQVDAYKLMGKTTPFVTLGYKMYGDKAGLNLNDVFYGTVGFSQKLDKRSSAGLMLDLRERSSASGSPKRELTAFYSRKLSSSRKLQLYVTKGFSDGSPDVAIGAMIKFSY